LYYNIIPMLVSSIAYLVATGAEEEESTAVTSPSSSFPISIACSSKIVCDRVINKQLIRCKHIYDIYTAVTSPPSFPISIACSSKMACDRVINKQFIRCRHICTHIYDIIHKHI